MEVDRLLHAVAWTPEPKPTGADTGELYATHSGALELLGHRLRCYRLNDGRTLINADDVAAFFGSPATTQTEA